MYRAADPAGTFLLIGIIHVGVSLIAAHHVLADGQPNENGDTNSYEQGGKYSLGSYIFSLLAYNSLFIESTRAVLKITGKRFVYQIRNASILESIVKCYWVLLSAGVVQTVVAFTLLYVENINDIVIVIQASFQICMIIALFFAIDKVNSVLRFRRFN